MATSHKLINKLNVSNIINILANESYLHDNFVITNVRNIAQT